MAKLWEGMIEGEKSNAIESFNASINFDKTMYREDIEGSIAHATMLCSIGVLTSEECSSIVEGLKEIEKDIESGNFKFEQSLEDIHTHIEMSLRERIGDAAGKLHTARSRNDQVNVDVRLYLRKSINKIEAGINGFLSALLEMSKNTVDIIMPGYTHLQAAQPMRLAHLFMGYFFMIERDRGRFRDCYKRLNMLTLGSGAFSGVGYNIDREQTRELLGFDKVSENALDSVADRDFIAEFGSAVSIMFSHFSKISEDMIIFNSPQYNFIVIDDLYTTGSSIMPNKKNADIFELIRGKTGRVYGNLIGILTVLKSLPSAYNKDLQEDKEGLFDFIDTTLACLEMITECVSTLSFNKENMANACERGYINAVEIADYLVGRGMPFREAHNVVARVVGQLSKAGRVFKDLSIDEWKAFSDKFEDDVASVLDIEYSVEKKVSAGGTSKASVLEQIKTASAMI